MHVVATAGHVDHGKSTLVRALTGSEPDRLDEERRRGLSIELGYCATSMPPVGDVAFVDVPGHERFLSTMLSGVGPVPAVLFVVAADDPWMPQAAEHLAALDGLGVSRAVLVVTRCDLAEPGPILARARAELDRTAMRGSPAVTVSGRTGAGLAELRELVVDMVTSLPKPAEDSDVRLWVDRCFHVRGAGTVATGTLPAGRIGVGDVLAVDGRTVRVRGVECLDIPVPSVAGVARVALNLTGEGVDRLDRNSVLVTPDAWIFAGVVDVRVSRVAREPDGASAAKGGARLPERPMLHIGATAVATHARGLADDLVRLSLDRALPLRIGDRALLRDPGDREVWGVTVLDPVPERLRRRGAASILAAELAGHPGTPDLAEEVGRRGVVALSQLRKLGVDTGPALGSTLPATIGAVVGDWLISSEMLEQTRDRLELLVREHDALSPLEPGVPVVAAAKSLGLPGPELVAPLVRAPMSIAGGRVVTERSDVLPEPLERALVDLAHDLEGSAFAAPTADRMRELQLDAKAVAAADRAGRLLRLADGVVLLPDADRLAAERLGDLPQPFTTSQARVCLQTSRRVVLPLLAHLDRIGATRRMADDRRTVVSG